jgi:hypothetical protein
VGLLASIYSFVGGTISTTSDFDRLDMGDTSAVPDLALDACSAVPVLGWFCNVGGARRNSPQPIYIGQP